METRKKKNVALGAEYKIKALSVFGGGVFALRATSGVISTVIAVERCLCVVFPLSASTLIRTPTMAAFLCLGFILLVSCSLVYRLSGSAGFYTIQNNTIWFLLPTPFYQKFSIITTLLGNIMLETVILFASVLIVCVSTAVTVQRLRAAATWRQKTSLTSGSISSQQMALSSMLIVVSLIYILTSGPVVTWSIVTVFLRNFNATQRSYSTFMAMSVVVHICPQVNSCVHIFVYYFRSQRFCETLKEVFCVQKRNHIC